MQKETTATKPASGDNNLDKGDKALQKHLLPGEVFKTNAPKTLNEFQRASSGLRDLHTADEIANSLIQSGLYESVRVLYVAFGTDGNLIKGCAAVVAKPKPIRST